MHEKLFYLCVGGNHFEFKGQNRGHFDRNT